MNDKSKKAIMDLTKALPLIPEVTCKKCTLEVATMHTAISVIIANDKAIKDCKEKIETQKARMRECGSGSIGELQYAASINAYVRILIILEDENK